MPKGGWQTQRRTESLRQQLMAERVAYRFEPLPKQLEFLRAREKEVLYSGAFGAGKSRVLCEKAYLLSHHYPGNSGAIMRKTAASLTHTTLKTLLSKVIPPSRIIEHRKQAKEIVVRSRDPKRPSSIIYGGVDDPTKVGSLEVSWIACDEAVEFEEADWMMLLGRLRSKEAPVRQIFTATNPDAPGHWMYRRFYDEGGPHRRVIEANAYDNPHNPEDYRELLDTFTGVFRERYVLGKWVGFDGVVYPEWNPTVHLVAPFTVPADWPRYRVIDFGTENPFVCLWIATNPTTGQAVVYRQHYMSSRTVNYHADVINRHSRGEDYEWTVADHDAGDRLILHESGIQTVPAEKAVDEGIQRVSQRLVYDDEKPPGLVIMRGCVIETDTRLEMMGKPTSLETEVGGYRWKKSRAGVSPEKDAPRKVDDHGLDALRYWAMKHDAYRGARRPAYKGRGGSDSTARKHRWLR